MSNISFIIFTGRANKKLAISVANYLNIKLGKINIGNFSDGEITVEIEENVRGKDIFILQPICSPPNENLMEIVIIADALRRSAAGRITAVIPYFGYARQDRKQNSKIVPISAKVIANILQISGIDRILTIDLHSEQIQGFFDIPLDNIYSNSIILNDIKKLKLENFSIVSPDIGGIVRSRFISDKLNSNLIIIDKKRTNKNVSKIIDIIGNIDKKNYIIVDDIVDTAGTICKAADTLKNKGAKKVYAYCTHAVLSGNSIDTILKSKLDRLIVTDSIPLRKKAILCDKIISLSCADTIGKKILEISNADSLTSLFIKR